MTRTFEATPATRRRTHLLLGLSGPSGSGKTRSALRVATGMVRVFGGKIAFLDTEANRALHYAPKDGENADPSKGTYDFLHVPFGAPFGPLDYLEALDYCRSKGATVIVVDSMSHEHEGPGGVLEQHEAECRRLAEAWRSSVDAVKMAAWQKPKSERRRLINGLLQMPISFVFCFRAKEKIRIPAAGETDDRGKKAKPSALGYLPIAGEEFVFEQTANVLLLPGARGVPEWSPEEPGERALVKCPDYLQHCFPKGAVLSEETGEAMALWAEGKSKGEAPKKEQPTPAPVDLIESVRTALVGDLEMDAAAAKAWVEKYFGAGMKVQRMTAIQARAALELARHAYAAPTDDEGHAAIYDRLKAERSVL